MLEVICLQLPLHSRGQASASFDGKARQRLSGGDAVVVLLVCQYTFEVLYIQQFKCCPTICAIEFFSQLSYGGLYASPDVFIIPAS
jgi:hypothetical protein